MSTRRQRRDFPPVREVPTSVRTMHAEGELPEGFLVADRILHEGRDPSRLISKTGVGSPSSSDGTGFVQELRWKRPHPVDPGYNNEELRRASSPTAPSTPDAPARLPGRTGSAFDALVGFAWPGGTVGVSFPFARQRAGESASRFARLLAELRSATPVIDLNTHSLGAHVVLRSVRGGAQRVVRNAWNFAVGGGQRVDRGRRALLRGQPAVRRFYVFHSGTIQCCACGIASATPGFRHRARILRPGGPGAIIKHSKNVRVINCKDVVESHGGYRSSGQVWA